MGIDFSLEQDEENLLKYTREGNFNEIRSLLSKTKVDINYENNISQTALMIACDCNTGNTKIINLLIENGAKIDYKNRLGDTALLNCAFRNKIFSGIYFYKRT